MNPLQRSYWLATVADLPAVARARATLRRFRKLGDPDRAELFATAQQLEIGQRRSNIEWIADRIAEQPVTRLVELGTQRGGNAFYLSQILPSGSRLVTVDLHPRLTHLLTSHNSRLASRRKRRAGHAARKRWLPFSAGCSLPRAALIRRYSTWRCRVIPYFTRLDPFEDAHFVAGELLRGQIDVIFYDADKRPEAVAEILGAYLPFLRPGGLLVLDDIRREPDSSNGGMRRYWDSLPDGEFVKLGETPALPEHPGSGLGAAQKR